MIKFIRILLRLIGYVLLLTLLVVLLFVIPHIMHLDYVVRSRFEGRRWSLPARVYARPLELYVGRTLTPEDLQNELERLNYDKTVSLGRVGNYNRQGNQFTIRTRPFKFWDGDEPSRTLRVNFDSQGLSVLKDNETAQDLPLVRLDATLIASIYPSDQEDRILIQREKIPKLFVETLLAAEDRQFFNHYGIDPIGMIRATWSNLQAGHVVQGGSTLTQQLVKNFYLSNERSMLRKFNEAIMALVLDLRYSKDKILETYANEIYLGQDGSRAIHGFGLASNFFFDADLADLDLSRAALLVGMVKGPSYYDPRRHPKRAYFRRNTVLDIMVEQGVINIEQARRAKQADLGVSNKGRSRTAGLYPAFMDLVREQLRRDYREDDLRSEGLVVFTTLDPIIQAHAEAGVAKRLPILEKSSRIKELEAAVVVASNDNGEILALVGGKNSRYSGFNRALGAVRSIGSLVKPVVYLEALERKNYNLFTMLADEPVTIYNGERGEVWKPKNYGLKAHGLVPFYQALMHSYNLATVNLGLELGLPSVIARLQAFGVQRHIPEVGPVLLGAISLSPVEVAQIYQAIASGGFLAPLRTVRGVLDVSGQLLNHYPLEVREVANPQSVWLLTWAMLQVVEHGTAKELPSKLPPGLKVAGKTGTTDNYRDSWFAGFTGDKVVVVWVGRDDNSPAGLTGSTGAMLVWADIVAACDNQPWDAPVPNGISLHWVNKQGLTVKANCPSAQLAPFPKSHIPKISGYCGQKRNLIP